MDQVNGILESLQLKAKEDERKEEVAFEERQRVLWKVSLIIVILFSPLFTLFDGLKWLLQSFFEQLSNVFKLEFASSSPSPSATSLPRSFF